MFWNPLKTLFKIFSIIPVLMKAVTTVENIQKEIENKEITLPNKESYETIKEEALNIIKRELATKALKALEKRGITIKEIGSLVDLAVMVKNRKKR